jgi:hypothetical protein
MRTKCPLAPAAGPATPPRPACVRHGTGGIAGCPHMLAPAHGAPAAGPASYAPPPRPASCADSDMPISDCLS